MYKSFNIDSPAWDIDHFKRVDAYAAKIAKLYDKAVKEAVKIASLNPNYDPNKPFSFADYPQTKKQAKKLFDELATQMKTVIDDGAEKEWMEACSKNDKFAESLKFFKDKYPEYFNNNLDALAAFQNRKMNGMNLSDRVWKYTNQFKSEIELGIDIGLGEGKSAAELSRDVRQYLNEPNKLFRRVRDKHGVLRLSKAAKAYHPGRGVYRSSYKNAMRLTRTEINMAYRTSDHERWKELDFVAGFEIRLSNNHPVTDICDDLKGKYPKEFKWTGWHPHCYDDMSEVLTNRGWLLFKDTTANDKILSLNPVNHNLEWSAIEQSFYMEYDGELIHFFNKSLDCMVTPDHEMVYLNKSDGNIKRGIAEKYTQGKGAIYRGCKWIGDYKETININGKELNFNGFCEFMGYWLSDGSTIRNYQIVIAQQDGDPNKQKIVTCIENLGFKVHTSKSKVEFYCKELCSYLKQFGTSHNKYIPNEIKISAKSQIKIFLDAFISCDGHIKTTKPFVGNRGGLFNSTDERTYCTTSPQMASDIGELLLKIDKRPSYRVNKIGGKTIKFKNGEYTINYDCIVISECKSKTATVFKKEKVNYTGRVYDLTLEKNAIMYIRRNGKCFWGSNCRCHKISILATNKEFNDLEMDMLNGKNVSGFQSVNEVKDVPDNYKDWIKTNKDKIIDAEAKGKLPYFIQDNYKGKQFSGGMNFEPKKTKQILPTKFIMTDESLKRIESLVTTCSVNKDVYNEIISGFDFEEFYKATESMLKNNGIKVTYSDLKTHSKSVYFSINGKYSNGQVFSLVRSFNKDIPYLKSAKVRTVNHELLKIPDDLQGKGMSKNLFKELYKQYQNADIKCIKVHANIDVGSYTWGKYGFSATDIGDIPKYIENAIQLGKLNTLESKQAGRILAELKNWDFGKKPYPVHKIAKTTWGKKALLWSNWYGEINLAIKKERDIFEDYLFGK